VAGTFTNLQPVFGTILAVLAGELLAWNQAVGGLIAILGVWLCEGGKKEYDQSGTLSAERPAATGSLEEG